MTLTWIEISITEKITLIPLFIISFHSQQLNKTEFYISLHLHPPLSIVYLNFLDTYIRKWEAAEKYHRLFNEKKEHVPDDIILIYTCNIYLLWIPDDRICK